MIIKPHQALDYIAPFLPTKPTIVEAGGFTGTTTVKMAARWPHATIHAFEPVPTIFEQLQKNTAAYHNIHCHQYALSNQRGTALMHVAHNPEKHSEVSQASSLLTPTGRLTKSPITYPETIIVQTITLNDWTAQNKISTIDLLWLDCQGNELAILKNAPIDSVKVLYIEVNFIQAYEQQASFEETIAWLSEHHFVEIARDFENMEKWFFGNCLFVSRI